MCYVIYMVCTPLQALSVTKLFGFVLTCFLVHKARLATQLDVLHPFPSVCWHECRVISCVAFLILHTAGWSLSKIDPL